MRNIIKEKIGEYLYILIEEFSLKEKDIIEINYNEIVNSIYELIKDKEIKEIKNSNYYKVVIDKYI